MDTYIYAFLFCGFVCMVSQLILDNTKLTPGHVTSLFVIIGAALDLAGIYDKIVLYAGGGAIIPITSFGHLLIHGAMDVANENGIMGLPLSAVAKLVIAVLNERTIFLWSHSHPA